jgi:hypothetical protein
MKNKIIVLLVLIGFLTACKRGPHPGCGSCPDFDRKDYKKKTR